MSNPSNRRITGPYTAIIDGVSTGLVGCANAESCPNATECLRASPELVLRVAHRSPEGACRSMIHRATN